MLFNDEAFAQIPGQLAIECGPNCGVDRPLCDECSQRVGKFGTCLQCGGPQNALWSNPYLKDPDMSYCSRDCVLAVMRDER